jgi:hemerythrin
MPLMTWNDRYSVGVKAIDGQHSVLFDIINELHAAMLKGQAQSVTGPLLHKLVKYTHEHFAAEEKLMASVNYMGLASHKVLHRDLVKQVEEYIVRFEKGEIAVNVDLLNFLRDWLTKHILKTDHEYGPWLNEHGVH